MGFMWEGAQLRPCPWRSDGGAEGRVPQRKVVRAGIAQLRSGFCLEEDGGRRRREEVGDERKKGQQVHRVATMGHL